MPFVSSKQRALCFSLKSKGKNGSWDCQEWSKETKGRKLPTKIKSKKK